MLGYLSVVVLLQLVGEGFGHGMLFDPAPRASLWRHVRWCRSTSVVDINYQDNELNCGGRYNQWERFHGKCGVCGDDFNAAVQQNQPGGKYARKVVSKCYQRGRNLDVVVNITANHRGYVEFRLCPNNDFSRPVNQTCLDNNLLQILDSNGRVVGTERKVLEDEKVLYVTLKVPRHIKCWQCVLQWRYIAGNNWGCQNVAPGVRKCGIGYGSQPESFFNCADIAIMDNCRRVRTLNDYSRRCIRTKTTPVNFDFRAAAPFVDMDLVIKERANGGRHSGGDPDSRNPGTCKAISIWAKVKGMHNWCRKSCPELCPDFMCECP